jgi:phosphotransferase system IIB component
LRENIRKYRACSTRRRRVMHEESAAPVHQGKHATC